jgi:hypothetical protein
VWVVTPCSLVEIYQSFGGTYCLHLQSSACSLLISTFLFGSYFSTPKLETYVAEETSIGFYPTTRSHHPQNSTLHMQDCKNIKSREGGITSNHLSGWLLSLPFKVTLARHLLSVDHEISNKIKSAKRNYTTWWIQRQIVTGAPATEKRCNLNFVHFKYETEII